MEIEIEELAKELKEISNDVSLVNRQMLASFIISKGYGKDKNLIPLEYHKLESFLNNHPHRGIDCTSTQLAKDICAKFGLPSSAYEVNDKPTPDYWHCNSCNSYFDEDMDECDKPYQQTLI